MKTINFLGLGFVILGLAGCQSVPRGSYPVFRVPGGSAFEFKDASTKETVVERLKEQATIYLGRSDDAREGLLDLQTGMLGGAVVGAVGGIVGNFATVASGAGIAVGSSLLAQQYSLAAQTGIYDTAAKRVMCVATVLEVSTVVSPDLQEVVVAARSASTRILMDLRRSLGELKVPEVNATSVAALYAARIAQSVKFENNKPFFASTIDATQSVKLDISSCAETGQPVSTTVAPLVVQ